MRSDELLRNVNRFGDEQEKVFKWNKVTSVIWWSLYRSTFFSLNLLNNTEVGVKFCSSTYFAKQFHPKQYVFADRYTTDRKIQSNYLVEYWESFDQFNVTVAKVLAFFTSFELFSFTAIFGNNKLHHFCFNFYSNSVSFEQCVNVNPHGVSTWKTKVNQTSAMKELFELNTDYFGHLMYGSVYRKLFFS